MEKAKQVGSSSSSFTSDIFGPKEYSNPSPSVFGSLFGPSSTGLGKDSPHYGKGGASYGTHCISENHGTHCISENHGTSDHMDKKNEGEKKGMINKDMSSTYQNDRAEPCYFSSSIYYGGRQVYSPATTHTTTSHQMPARKDVWEDDQNGSDSSCASRGNWWEGSLYY